MTEDAVNLASVVRDVTRELGALEDDDLNEGYYRAELLSLRAAAVPTTPAIDPPGH